MNPSTAQARVLVDELVRNTVSHVVLCPGSRNAPLSIALYHAAAAGRLTLHVRIDERSAVFLALGIAARMGCPVAVVCTSGTASANFHPAVLEADRAGVPLIVLTADRPPELRAAGASQVVDQRGIYGTAVRYSDELAVAERKGGQNSYWRSQICRVWNAAYGEWRSGPVHRGHSYALLGDLTFLHDVNGLLTGPAETRPDLTIVVVNDDGGGIFSLLEQGAPEHSDSFERVFGTPHGADLGALCAGYQVPYLRARSRAEFREALRPAPGLRVVEVRVDRAGRRELHARLRTAVAKAVG